MKKCIKCNIFKILDEFDFRKDTNTIRNQCHNCIYQAQREKLLKIYSYKKPKFLKIDKLKRCTKCTEYKEYHLFQKRLNSKDGLTSNCKKCIQIKQNERRLNNKKFIEQYKNKPCLDCHKQFPPYSMDFDHINKNKLFEISQCLNKSITSLLKEISKCELVCANCHRIRTKQRQNSNYKLYGIKKIIYDIKFNQPCADCKENFPTECLEFDHLPEKGKKLFNIGAPPANSTKEDILLELSKCEIVCRNCHRIRTIKRMKND